MAQPEKNTKDPEEVVARSGLVALHAVVYITREEAERAWDLDVLLSDKLDDVWTQLERVARPAMKAQGWDVNV